MGHETHGTTRSSLGRFRWMGLMGPMGPMGHPPDKIGRLSAQPAAGSWKLAAGSWPAEKYFCASTGCNGAVAFRALDARGACGKLMEPVIDFDLIDEHGPQHYEAALELSAADLDRDELPSGGTASVTVDADRGDAPSEYLVNGNVSFKGELECARCTDAYPFAAEAGFTVRYRPVPRTEDVGLETEVTSHELDVEFTDERQVPLRKIAVEQVQLAIPMKPLCDESCQGLCVGCGANRNREECACDTKITDPRWEGLSALRDQLSRKNEN